MGARNISAVVAMPTACFRSRRYTPSAASSQTVPATNGRKHSTTIGKKITVQESWPMTNGEITSNASVDTHKWNSPEPRVLQVSVSSGNTTRLTKLVFSTINVVARFAHSENNALMLSPANNTMAYWNGSFACAFQRDLKTTPNTKV